LRRSIQIEARCCAVYCSWSAKLVKSYFPDTYAVGLMQRNELIWSFQCPPING
jgi:hypothetical protein